MVCKNENDRYSFIADKTIQIVIQWTECAAMSEYYFSIWLIDNTMISDDIDMLERSLSFHSS